MCINILQTWNVVMVLLLEVKWSESRSVVSDTFQPHELYSPWNSSGQNTGMGSLSLLQEIFPTQGSNPGLPHCRRILYQLNHKGSPRILEWVAYPFSRESSQPRNRTWVSCIAGRFFTNWVIREALSFWITFLFYYSNKYFLSAWKRPKKHQSHDKSTVNLELCE